MNKKQSCIAKRADLFVATNGNDKWSGTLPEPNKDRTDGPLATLAKARDKVRELKKKNPKKDITVLIRGGTYTLTKTVVFGLEDSGSEKQTITYAAYPGEEPVFSSGIKIKGWRKLKDEPNSLPAKARGKIWVADVPEGLGRFFTLFDGDKRLPRARSKGFLPARTFNYESSHGNMNIVKPEDRPLLTVLPFPKGALKNWSNLEDIEILVCPVPWTMNILPLESVDEDSCVARTSIEMTAPAGRPEDFTESVWVENAIDFLDERGEWVLNTRERKIYLWPEGDSPGDNIVAPCLKEFIRVEGNIDFEGPIDKPVRNLVFRGLTFTHGERDLWDKDHKGWGLQHDWEKYDRATALVRFRGAENCAIEECHFKNSGGAAIRLDLYCQKNRIVRNLIEHIGGMGILLCGYGPGTKDVNRYNEIVNNHIHHCGEIYWHSHAIMVWQSGHNRIAHNCIHHVPRKAICISGVRVPSFEEGDFAESAKTIRWKEIGEDFLKRKFWTRVVERTEWRRWDRFVPYLHARNNIVEYNEIYRVLEKLGDGGAINLSGGGVGNVIRRNYIHHILNSICDAAIREDGFQKETLITENIIYKCSVDGIVRRQLTHVENNIIVDVAGSKKRGYRGYIRFGGFGGGPEIPGGRPRVQKNILYDSGSNPKFYSIDPASMQIYPEDCEADYNLFYCAGNPELAVGFLNEQKKGGIEKHSIVADPLFIDIENGDFRLKADSPALKIGFKQFDLDKIGLLEDFPERFRDKEDK